MEDVPDPIVAEVLALDDSLRRAYADRDYPTLERLHAAEFMLNGPAGTMQSRAETFAILRSTTANQIENERVVEAAFASGDVVVIMGHETVVWQGTGRPELDGQRSARRFTNVWRRDGGAGEWRYIARQATTVPLRRDGV